MDAGFLERLLGDRTWAGPCVVILDAEAAVDTFGQDSIVTGGQRSYAPRLATGRLVADAALLLREEGILLVAEQRRVKDVNTAQTQIKQNLLVVDVRHVVGLEFAHLGALKALGVPNPPVAQEKEYRPGVLVG